MQEGALIFENAQVRLGLAPDLGLREMVLKEAFEGTFSLKQAAEMAVILEGVTTSLSFLPGSGRSLRRSR
jgi:hypothetical protein